MLKHPIGLSLFQLIGPGLVAKEHDQISVNYACQHPADQGQIQVEAGIGLGAREIKGNHRYIVKARPGQGLADDVNIVGGPAASAGLHDNKRYLVGIVRPGSQSIQELAGDQKRGVTDIVVCIFKPQGFDPLPGIVQQRHLVALVQEDIAHDVEVDGQHIGHQDSVFLFHFLGKKEPSVLVILEFRHSLVISPSAAPARPAGCAGAPLRCRD